ncbi:glycosyltransferase family 4 protein [Marinomonas sp. 2405UD68-3]|uniref:glycosyltransferase family 4 protein n=1 Tax=Marinomonas sp. 2405UD68-3 TaxID=3391835 RepID=UPI0039C9BE37
MKKNNLICFVKVKIKENLVVFIRFLMNIPRVRYFSAKIINRLPFVKNALLRLLSSVPEEIVKIKRSMGHLDDYDDIFPSYFRVKHSNYIHKINKIESDIDKIILNGHFDGSYSLASVNRNIINRILYDFPKVNIFIQPYEGEISSKVFSTPKGEEEVLRLNSILHDEGSEIAGKSRRISIYHHYPLITPDINDDTSISLFFWEESKVPDDIINKLNDKYNGVLVATWFVKKVLEDSGCVLPIQIVPLPIEAYPNNTLKIAKKSKKVTFLHVSSCFPRKGVDLLLKAFDLAAEKDKDIHLVIKTFPNPHNKIHTWIQKYVRSSLQERVEIIESDMTSHEMSLLYQASDAVVLPTRGEGLNLPAIEAGVYKKPLIVTGYGAHMDFVDKNNSYLLDYRFSNSDTHLTDTDSVWTEVSVPKLSEILTVLSTKIKKGDPSVKERSEKLHEVVQETFFSKTSVQRFLSGIYNIQQHKDINEFHDDNGHLVKKLKINLFSTWGEECGIAEYSQYLINSMLSDNNSIEIHHPIKRRLFSSNLDELLSIKESWFYGSEGPDLKSLKLEGQILWIQHHFAFYGLTQKLAEGIEYQNDQGKLTYITLHTTRPLLSYEKPSLQIAIKCLALFTRILVHAVDDLNTLKRLGLVDNVMLMPQGIRKPLSKEIKKGKESPLIVGCFGFLLPHKGIELLIKGFSSALKSKKIPAGSRLKLVNAVRSDGVSFNEKSRCENLVTELGLNENVEWFSDFLPIEECESILSNCHTIILPYQFTLESCSGAVRNAIVSCHHVATTPAPIFDEVRDITHSLEGYSSDHIELFLSDFSERYGSGYYDELLLKREKWLLNHDWSVIANRHKSLFIANQVNEKFNNSIVIK